MLHEGSLEEHGLPGQSDLMPPEEFQAQRDAIYAAEKQKQMDDKIETGRSTQRFLRRAKELVDDAHWTNKSAREKRANLVFQHRNEAKEVSRQLEEGLQRSRLAIQELQDQVKSHHDEVIADRWDPSLDVEAEEDQYHESPTHDPGIRENFRTRSRSWSAVPATPQSPGHELKHVPNVEDVQA